jgi:hypothetical protein
MGIDNEHMEAARLFVDDEAAFVGALLSSSFGVKQDSLAKMFERSQSTISRYLNDYTKNQAAHGGSPIHAQ